MWNKNISKKIYSEWVVRNSLYWMSAYSAWTLDSSDDNWVITFESDADEIKSDLDRLLNDYKLRESLHLETSSLRTSIIQSVLKSIDARLSE